MIIGTIVNGVVIDHIPAGRAMELYRYLNLDQLQCEVAIIENALSQKHGKKDIIKINEIIDIDMDVLGYIDPDMTVDIIRNGKRAEKMHPDMPEQVVDMICCKNPRCITSVERGLPQIFKLTDREKRVYRCAYCEAQAK